MRPLLQRVATAWRNFRPPAQKSLAALADVLGDNTGTAASGGTGGQSVWAYACVSLIGRTLGATPFRLTDRGRLLKDGPAVNLFENPHPRMTGCDLWDLTVAWLLLRGRAFVVGVDGTGSVVRLRGAGALRPPRHLMVLNADRVRPDFQQGELLGYRHHPGHDDIVRETYLGSDEVVALRLPSPFGFHDAQAPAAVAALAAQTDAAAALFMSGLMLNNADTGVIVETDQQPNEAQREQILAALRSRKRAAGTADRPLLLWGGFKVVKPAISSTDLQFLENRKFARQEICAVFGVPQELLGFTEDANRSVSDSARANFVEYTVGPLAERIADGVQPLVRLFGRELRGHFDLGALPVMRAAQRERFAVAQRAQLMGVPLRTVNQVFNLGLPELPGDGDSVRPFGLTVVGQLPASASPASAGSENAFQRLARHYARSEPGFPARRAGRAGSDKMQAGPAGGSTSTFGGADPVGATSRADYPGTGSAAASSSPKP